MIIKVTATAPKFAVVRLNGDAVGIYETTDDAQFHARKLLSRGYKREAIACTWEPAAPLFKEIKKVKAACLATRLQFGQTSSPDIERMAAFLKLNRKVRAQKAA